MIETFIEDETGRFTPSMAELVKSVVNKAAQIEGFEVHSEVDILIVENDGIRQINKEHRGIDQATDVLSFPMEDFEEDGILGDIVISIDRVEEQSEEYGHSFERELGFLTAHGMLHLFGYDHEEQEDEKEMIEKQEKVLFELDLGR